MPEADDPLPEVAPPEVAPLLLEPEASTVGVVLVVPVEELPLPEVEPVPEEELLLPEVEPVPEEELPVLEELLDEAPAAP